jgi:hypothetical protein
MLLCVLLLNLFFDHDKVGLQIEELASPDIQELFSDSITFDHAQKGSIGG